MGGIIPESVALRRPEPPIMWELTITWVFVSRGHRTYLESTGSVGVLDPKGRGRLGAAVLVTTKTGKRISQQRTKSACGRPRRPAESHLLRFLTGG